MLARLAPARWAGLIAATPPVKITAQTETDPDVLMRRIEQAAKDGFAIVHNQTVIGDISVAAPILGHGGHPIGAINIAVPATRWTVGRVEAELLPHVLLASTSISEISR